MTYDFEEKARKKFWKEIGQYEKDFEALLNSPIRNEGYLTELIGIQIPEMSIDLLFRDDEYFYAYQNRVYAKNIQNQYEEEHDIQQLIQICPESIYFELPYDYYRFHRDMPEIFHIFNHVKIDDVFFPNYMRRGTFRIMINDYLSHGQAIIFSDNQVMQPRLINVLETNK